MPTSAASRANAPAAPTPASLFPGPAALGRAVVVRDGGAVPAGFPSDTPRVRIDALTLADPDAVVERLHLAWVLREPVVIELAVAPSVLAEPERRAASPLDLGPRFLFPRERLSFLVWANSWDARGSGQPRWWHGHRAQEHGAVAGTTTDVVLADGTAVWVDGGPRGPVRDSDGGALPIVHREAVLLGRLTADGVGAPNDDLAADQLEAVSHAFGPARIIAPAGSGKTRVLTARLRHLLRERLVQPELVTAVAYNNKAAAELRDRLGGLSVNVRTVHSLALAICRLERDWRVIDERDVRALLEQRLKPPRVPNKDPLAPYLEALEEVRLGLRDPGLVEASRDDVDGFADLFGWYHEQLVDRGWLDFGQMVIHAIEVLLRDVGIRGQVQRWCTHLLVDEFQDLTPAFILLLRLCAAPELQVFGVGDDDQVIYGHAGADPRFLIDYATWFPGAASHPLQVNYRCPPDVVDGAATLLSHNRTRVDKTIRSGRDGAPAGLRRVAGPSEEQAAIAVGIVREWLAEGVAPAQIAVLTRVNATLLPMQIALGMEALPAAAPLDTTVLGRTGVRSALAWLRIAAQPDRIARDDLMDTLRRPQSKLASKIQPLLPRGRPVSLQWMADLDSSLGTAGSERLATWLAHVDRLHALVDRGGTTEAALRMVRDRIGLDGAVENLDLSRRVTGSSHADDLDALTQLAHLHDDPRTFRNWLMERLRHPGVDDGIVLSSVHRVKGMEWDRVIVFGANDGLFPHRLADDVEEERRVFHVAVTRCRDQVLVVSASEQTSPFVAELTEAWTPSRPAVVSAASMTAPSALTSATSRRSAPDDALDAADTQLFQQLRAWRGVRAREKSLPAYIIFTDKALRAVARERPATVSDLLDLPGIGPVKVDAYGGDLLQLVAEFDPADPPADAAPTAAVPF